jgi:hypothetical protein
MEDVLSVYARPYDPRYPVVCLDESNKLLEAHTPGHIPLPPTAESGAVQRIDYSYQPRGCANLFMVCEPLRGWRRVAVSEQRRGIDVAEQLRRIVDEDFPEAERIVLVTDNLNVHHAGVLYERYPPEEARRIAEKLEWHYTPKHGSWLNVAEIELSVLHQQCLPRYRRIPDVPTLQYEVSAWEQARNAEAVAVDWQFTTADARIKLKRLYPIIISS